MPLACLDDILHLASNCGWLYSSSRGRGSHVLPYDLPGSTSNRHGIFQNLCYISSTSCQSCNLWFDTWLLSVSPSTRTFQQGMELSNFHVIRFYLDFRNIYFSIFLHYLKIWCLFVLKYIYNLDYYLIQFGQHLITCPHHQSIICTISFTSWNTGEMAWFID